MIEKIRQYIKSNGLYFFIGLGFVTAGGLYWAVRIVPVTSRVVLNSTNLPKLAIYSLILPILIFLSLYPFNKKRHSNPLREQKQKSFNRLLSQRLGAGLFVFLILFCISSGIVSSINAGLDKSAPDIYQVKVISKGIWHCRFSKNYELKVKSWFDPNATYTIDLSRSEYNDLNVRPDDEVYLGIKKGSLRLDWIESITKVQTHETKNKR